MSRLKKILVPVAATLMCAFAVAMFGYNLLPECATEDSSNCVWYATVQGNGEGRSFIDLGGNIYYLP